MFLQKLDSVASKAQSREPFNSIHVSLFFFTCFTIFFLQCSGLDGPFRPNRPIHRPHWPLPWTLLPLNQTSNVTLISEYTTSSYTPTTVTEGSTTETLPPKENYDVLLDYEEYADKDKWSGVPEKRKEDQVIMIRRTTAMPGVTVIDLPEYVSTEAFIKTTVPPKTPEEELNQMLEGLDNLLSNESSIVTVDNVSDAFDQLDILLDTDELDFPCAMLHALDALGARADLNGSQTVAAARHNVAVVMADSAPAHRVRGLRIAANDGFSDESFEIFHGDMDTNFLDSDNSEAVVNLPQSLSETSRRISFVVFRSDRAFLRHDRDDQYVVNSRVISVNAENFTQMNEGEVIDIHFKPLIHNHARNMTRACAYWHFAENGTGYWSQEGCTFISSASGLLDTCRCTHLTHFAEVLVPKAVFSEANEKALEIISLAGCFLSLFGLIVISLTAILFRSWRNDFNNKIWIQLTLALLINVTCFLIIVFSRFEHYTMFCFFVGVLLHYSVLASFCWMLVAAIISYRKLVLIFARDPSRKLLKASAFSWFCPLAIVTILVAVSPQSYVKRFEDKVPNAAFCYPSGLSLWLSVYSPIALIVLINWILFALIIRSVFATRKIQKHGDSSELLRRASVSCLLVFLFGLPWVFGLFAKNIVAAYLFTFTTTFQGFVLFIFFVIINTKTRDLWLNKLHMKKKKTKALVSSSLVTNRSEPARDESEQQAFIEPTSTRTNVTSLMSNSSNLRAVECNVSRDSAVIEDTNAFHRYESEGSFVTAKSFDNLHEDKKDDNLENDDENSLQIAIRKVVEEEDIKLRKKYEPDESRSSPSEKSEDDNNDGIVKNDENTSLRNSIKINNHDTSDKSTAKELHENNSDDESIVENHDADTSASHGTSYDSGGDQRDKNDSSQKQGNGNDKDFNSPEIIIYNVPMQNASLIS